MLHVELEQRHAPGAEEAARSEQRRQRHRRAAHCFGGEHLRVPLRCEDVVTLCPLLLWPERGVARHVGVEGQLHLPCLRGESEGQGGDAAAQASLLEVAPQELEGTRCGLEGEQLDGRPLPRQP
eukprot:scaffold90398_cov57-Phaeocystis_antarctica.AAC.2